MTTNIYGLYDPRDCQQLICYVGKGLDKRAESHWKAFQRTGKAINGNVRRWFEKLNAESVQPSWRFLDENVLDWEFAERAWIAYWRDLNPNLCNVLCGGNAYPFWCASIGGRTGGRIGGKRAHQLHPNLAKERLEKTWKNNREVMLKAARKAGKVGGLVGGHRVHEIYPDVAKENLQKYRDLHPELARENARKTNHRRWHAARGLNNPACEFCRRENMNATAAA